MESGLVIGSKDRGRELRGGSGSEMMHTQYMRPAPPSWHPRQASLNNRNTLFLILAPRQPLSILTGSREKTLAFSIPCQDPRSVMDQKCFSRGRGKTMDQKQAYEEGELEDAAHCWPGMPGG